MKVIVTKNLNVRVGAPSVNAPCYNYLAPGSTIEVDEKLIEGDIYDGNNLWYKGLDGSFYWSGGVNTFSPLLVTENKESFSWFEELGIETIWDTYNERGENVCIAVLDTGYNITNTDLLPAIPSQNQKVIINYKDAAACNTINDLKGHGTRCLSIVGARNFHQYNIGIAPKCKLLIGKISCKLEMLDRNSVLDGIKWAIDSGAEIISISFGFLFENENQQADFHARLQEIIKDHKVLIFASSGNNLGDVPRFEEYYPASFPECISVGATDHGVFNNITVRSNCTIIHAPGINIESYSLTNVPTPDSGTSFSTPITAGVTALAVSYCKKKNNNDWNPNEIMSTLKSTASPLFDNRKLIQPLDFFSQLSLKFKV
jgi:subtilisin family serine protease